jgi:hypothetical protein
MFRPVIEGDGVGYYSFLHATFVSHSLGFDSEYGAAQAAHIPVYTRWVTYRENGHLTDLFPVGSAVLSAPAYLVALALRPSGEPQYGSPFVESFVLSSLLLGLVALALCYAIACGVTRDRRAALIGTVAGVFATPYAYYLLSDPSYAHTFSVFAVSAFLFAWWKGPPATWRGWLGLGVLGGIMGMVRFQDGMLCLLVLVDLKRLRRPALAMLPGLLLGFAPQLLADQIQFGSLLPQRAPDQGLSLLNARYLGILFDSREGLFVWVPAAVLAVLGLVGLRDRRLKAAALVGLVVEVLVVGSTPDPSGAGLGPRRFLDLTPFAVVGFASLAAMVRPRAALVGLTMASAWNLLLIANFEYVMNRPDPGYAGLTLGQLQALEYVPRLFAKGAVIRDLLLPGVAGPGGTAAAIVLLVLEAFCVGVALVVARRATTISSIDESQPASRRVDDRKAPALT